MSISVVTKATDFMHLGLSDVNTLEEHRSFCTPDTRFERPADGYNWSAPGHVFGEVTVSGTSGTRSEQKYNHKTHFATRRENQDFERTNISMSQPPLDSTPFGTKKTNITMSPINSIPVGKKMPDPTLLTQKRILQQYQQIHQHEKKNHAYQRTRNLTHHHQTCHQANLICQMITITVNNNKRKRD